VPQLICSSSPGGHMGSTTITEIINFFFSLLLQTAQFIS
jgi:hypothetical protein